MKKKLRLIISATSVLAVGLLIASCNLGDPFSTYTGVNLIASQGFNSSPEQWTIWNSKITSYPYLTFSSVTSAVAGTTNGLPSSNDGYYLLNAPNLVPNGDFEAGIGGWSALSTQATDAAVSTSPNAIQGTSLQFDLNGNDTSFTPTHYAMIAYQLDGNIADIAVNNVYRILFDFNVSSTASSDFDFNNGTDSSYIGASPWTVTTRGSTLTSVLSFPTSLLSSQIVIHSGGQNYFSIGRFGANATNTEHGDLDNFRVVREDLESYLRLDVPYSASGRSDLISGTYEFSVWVKAEEASQVTPTTHNEFNATGLTLGINSARQPFVINNGVVAPSSPYSEPITLSNTTWQKVSMKANIQIDPPASGSTPVIHLYVTPTNIYAKDVGGILISTPTLTFLPNG